LANIDKLPDLPQQNESQPPDATSDIPNTEPSKSDSQPQADASVDGDTTTASVDGEATTVSASSHSDTTATDAQ